MSRIRECKCCGSSYSYCGNCGTDSNKPKWMVLFDKEECKSLFDAISGYNMGIKSKEDIDSVIEKYNITNYEKYNDGIKSVLNNVYSSNKKNKKKKIENGMDIDLTDEKDITDFGNTTTKEYTNEFDNSNSYYDEGVSI